MMIFIIALTIAAIFLFFALPIFRDNCDFAAKNGNAGDGGIT